MDGSGLAILEARLVDLRRDNVRACGLDSLKYCFLHDLGEVGSHHDGSYLINIVRTYTQCLL